MTGSPIDETAFIGKLTAGATHEIRNVLSVIKESAGLMEDLLDVEGADPFPHGDKFRKMIANILGQIERGSTLLKGLNTLAHATDDRMRAVDVRQVVECQSMLHARFSRLKGVTLTASQSVPQAYIITDPVRLHFAVCEVIDVLLEKASAGCDIALAYEVEDGRLAMECSLGPGEKLPEDWDAVEVRDETWQTARSVVESLGGSVEVRTSERSARLTFPLGRDRSAEA